MINKNTVNIAIMDGKTSRATVVKYVGKSLDNICFKAESVEDIYGAYSLEASFIIDKETKLYKNIKEEDLLKVKADYGEEVFRINKVRRNNRTLVVFARQITIDYTLKLWLNDVRPTNQSGQGALNWIMQNSDGPKDIFIHTDINKVATAYYENMNVYKALYDSEQSFTSRWGGETQRRMYNLYINNRIGTNRGVKLRSSKGIIGFESNVDMDKLCTRIKPVGFNGITIKGFVDSPLINNYATPYPDIFKYEDIKVKNENNPGEGFDTIEEAQAELIKRAKEEFEINKVDEVRADYRINNVQLEKTEEYKDFVSERIYIGDTVGVNEETLEIDIEVRAIKRKFDHISQSILELEFSNYDIKNKAPSVSDIINELQNVISDKNSFDEFVQGLINAGIKDSYVLVHQNEIVIGDTKDINTMTSCWRFNKNGLAHSNNGYYGKFNVAITSDGKIVADFIKTGILSAIIIQNLDGSLQIDLGGTNGIEFKKNGKRSITLNGTMMKFFDWDGEGDPVGQFYSTRFGSDKSKQGLAIASTLNKALSLAYQEEDGTYSNYVTFDKDDMLHKYAITFYENIRFLEKLFIQNEAEFFHNAIFNANLKIRNNNIFSTDDDRLILDNVKELKVQSGNNVTFLVSENDFIVSKNGKSYLYKEKDRDRIVSEFDALFDRNVHVNGNITCTGTINGKSAKEYTINEKDIKIEKLEQRILKIEKCLE